MELAVDRIETKEIEPAVAMDATAPYDWELLNFSRSASDSDPEAPAAPPDQLGTRNVSREAQTHSLCAEASVSSQVPSPASGSCPARAASPESQPRPKNTRWGRGAYDGIPAQDPNEGLEGPSVGAQHGSREPGLRHGTPRGFAPLSHSSLASATSAASSAAASSQPSETSLSPSRLTPPAANEEPSSELAVKPRASGEVAGDDVTQDVHVCVADEEMEEGTEEDAGEDLGEDMEEAPSAGAGESWVLAEGASAALPLGLHPAASGSDPQQTANSAAVLPRPGEHSTRQEGSGPSGTRYHEGAPALQETSPLRSVPGPASGASESVLGEAHATVALSRFRFGSEALGGTGFRGGPVGETAMVGGRETAAVVNQQRFSTTPVLTPRDVPIAEEWELVEDDAVASLSLASLSEPPWFWARGPGNFPGPGCPHQHGGQEEMSNTALCHSTVDLHNRSSLLRKSFHQSRAWEPHAPCCDPRCAAGSLGQCGRTLSAPAAHGRDWEGCGVCGLWEQWSEGPSGGAGCSVRANAELSTSSSAAKSSNTRSSAGNGPQQEQSSISALPRRGLALQDSGAPDKKAAAWTFMPGAGCSVLARACSWTVPLLPSATAVAVLGVLVALASSWGLTQLAQKRRLKASLAASERQRHELADKIRVLEHLLFSRAPGSPMPHVATLIPIVFK